MISPSSGMPSAGEFHVGCNYWASHSGAFMWSDWRPEMIDDDFARLAGFGLRTLRVFPLWPDFQPISRLIPSFWQPPVFAHGDRPLTEDEIHRGGVSEEMMSRFDHFANLAEKHQLRLIVGIITGWMSGRLFAPPAFMNVNVLTDPVAMQWQVRFVREFVTRFKNKKAIVAWDLGNECNCMGSTVRAESWLWTSTIVNAIRSADNTRRIVSGMHSLSPKVTASFNLQDQGELTDIMTVHPYPPFTPHAGLDPIDTMRSILHSTAEARFYGDIAKKPCMIEEFGTLGPYYAGPEQAANYVRSVLWSGWAHDCRAGLWWCAFDQNHLENPPYEWCACERELGLFDADAKPKPVLQEMSRFAKTIENFPVKKLPPRRIDAVCILSIDQDAWGVAYASFMLAKQAGFDLEFQYHDQAIKDSDFYLLPSVCNNVIGWRQWLELLERVHAGATLYTSIDTGSFSPFNEPFGVTILTREKRAATTRLRWQDGSDIDIEGDWKLRIRPDRATVIGREADDNPILTETQYGKGRLVLLAAPLEAKLAGKPGAFNGGSEAWKIYRWLGESLISKRSIRKQSPHVGVTEHAIDDRKRVIIVQNYSPEKCVEKLDAMQDWLPQEAWYGNPPTRPDGVWQCTLPANEVCVFTIER